ncbi:hypothetical protein [Mesoplasma florum]|uniref:hypothetical protein n=1 Tax=Mesoplasma florum TaxID=2151 RepID=UPI000BE33EBB|nr:hypothetical protein [Mesoplasma florum]ATI73517.1 hypothetical protein CQZ69_03070 [Mesoplasma florum]ATI74205.1 hypothetical protein CQZ70_03090 [Mesoplasma florum]AVN61215.1 hypothetical protein CG005_02930 [Mesoplasma florum]AVN61910.1 hypothetical protein CG004_03055 [Mesoplasma florum]
MKNNFEKINDIKIDENLNNKVFRDFIKYFENENKITISKSLYEKFEEVVSKIASYNNHKFVKPSDLFGMLFIEQEEIDDFENKFHESIKQTMFKEVITYKNLNSDIKDDFEVKYNNKTLTLEEKQHAAKLAEWIRKQVIIFSDKKLIEHNEQLDNKITGEMIKSFFKEQNEIFIRIYKWHANAFEIISN